MEMHEFPQPHDFIEVPLDPANDRVSLNKRSPPRIGVLFLQISFPHAGLNIIAFRMQLPSEVSTNPRLRFDVGWNKGSIKNHRRGTRGCHIGYSQAKVAEETICAQHWCSFLVQRSLVAAPSHRVHLTTPIPPTIQRLTLLPANRLHQPPPNLSHKVPLGRRLRHPAVFPHRVLKETHRPGCNPTHTSPNRVSIRRNSFV